MNGLGAKECRTAKMTVNGQALVNSISLKLRLNGLVLLSPFGHSSLLATLVIRLPSLAKIKQVLLLDW